jgi:pyruvate kinase
LSDFIREKTDVSAAPFMEENYSLRKDKSYETKISFPPDRKDIDDVHFMLDHNFDWIALSFVRQQRYTYIKGGQQRGKHTLVMARLRS